MKYRQKLVPEAVKVKVTSSGKNGKKYIVVHETDNTNTGADADAHARLQANGNSRQASWQWQVDDKEAVQSFPHNVICWAAGTSDGNVNGIHVEICVNRDGDFTTALENAAALVAKIMKDEKIPIERVVQHNYFSGKNCPRNVRANKPKSWSAFIQMVKSAGGIAVPAPAPTDTRKFRAYTGTFARIEHAENAREIMRSRFGWVAYTYKDGTGYRVKTGTFTGETAAKAAVKKIKDAGISSYAYYFKEEQ